MAPLRTTRRAVFSAASVTAAAVFIAAGLAAAPASNAAAPGTFAPCGELFDDFEYTGPSDPNFRAHEWTARAEAGGPGVPGATWSPANITFQNDGAEKVLQLSASTDGTAANTSHAELLQNRNRFLAGTYATRIKFADVPATGADGAHINQTFFTIGPAQRYDYDPLYSELDFSEYLPNGGWGEQGPINYQTSWNGYRLEPWDARNAHSEQRRSFDGWHDLVSQVSSGHVKYFIDGVQVGDHTFDPSGQYPVYPRVPMSLRYNLWFIDTATHPGGLSRYQQQVDWVYYAKNEVISPAEATSRAAARRAAGTGHTDTVDQNTCPDPSTSPTVSPSPTPTVSPTTPPTGSPSPTPTVPANCAGAPAWSWGTVYLEGQRVRHNGRLWQARWWTLGSEPGLTAQWADLGRC